ncbi:hypothetical protein GGR55DRAFT_385946 [Xylaria sp. FL0064]|nr:hypothetical protein GGR55DRAFT_385946 [Xylaria sp. FL0064]
MARLSCPAILFVIPIILFRGVLALFYYMFLGLFFIARNVCYHVFKSQADRPGPRSTTEQYPTRLLCYQENKKLLDAWSASATSKVLFVTIEVQVPDQQETRISEIALSRWSPGTPGIETMLWIIEDGGLRSNSNSAHRTSAFLYDATETIREDVISIHLGDIFQDFREEYERLYLVGYRINETLSIMKKVWAPPQDLVIIDTARVWQAQHKEITELSLEQCIERVPELQEYSFSLENTGNKARLGIQLLREQVDHFSLSYEIPDIRVIKEAFIHLLLEI